MPIDVTRIQAICFDVDGTLSDTDDLWVTRFQRLLHPLRFAFRGRQTQHFARRTMMLLESPGNAVYHLLDQLHLDDEAARLINLVSRQNKDRPPKKFWIIPGVAPMLDTLAQHFPLAVVSARGAQGTHHFLNQFQLLSFFRAVATAQTCEYTKPFPHPIQWAAAQMGVAPEACLMVGDTTVDIKAGKAAGAQTVGVLCGFGEENELRRAGADLILPSTANLIEILTNSSARQDN